MRKLQLVALAIAAAFAAFAGATAFAGSKAPSKVQASAQSAPDLRVTLDRLLGEHAQLAVIATREGYDGSRDFKTAAGVLDRNSVELAGAIGSVFGTQARNQFLNGRFMWRDHIKFFVQYTTALKTKNMAAQRRAVGNLRGYIEAFSGFLARATGLPQNALRASITEHVMQLKGQIDAYSKRNYASAYRLQRQAYSHMFMTGDTLAAAIVKKFPGRFTP